MRDASGKGRAVRTARDGSTYSGTAAPTPWHTVVALTVARMGPPVVMSVVLPASGWSMIGSLDRLAGYRLRKTEARARRDRVHGEGQPNGFSDVARRLDGVGTVSVARNLGA